MDPEQIPLRDLHLPDPVGWWPLAPGWWLLITLAVAGIVYLLYRQYRRWRHNRLRRIALAELSRVYNNYRQGTDALTLAKDISELLRRAMLAYSPRAEVAGLTGEPWLAWLDRGLEDQPFTTGVGRTIESLPYQRPESIDDDTDISGLIDVVRRRISTPLPEVTA
jgi:hypothetical protein